MASLGLFQLFDKEFYVEEQNIRPIELYILSNLNSNYSPCRRYWEKQYNLCNTFILSVTGERKKIYVQLLRKVKQCVTVN